MPDFPYNRYPYSNFHDLNLDWILDTIQELYRRIISYEGSATPYESDPRMDGVADPGSADNYARGDHRHPTDTSRMGKTEYYNDYGSTMVPYMDGAGSPGASYKWAHEDHQHPSDGNKYDKSGGRIYGPVEVDGALTLHGNTFSDGYTLKRNFHSYMTANAESGWHRVMEFAPSTVSYRQGRCGMIFDFFITRFGVDNETHKVSLSLVEDKIKFYGEHSNAISRYVDKIRYTYDGSKGYVDIHLNHTSLYNLTVDYNVYSSSTGFLDRITTRNLEAVAESPANETVATQYTMGANGTFLEQINGFLNFDHATIPNNGNVYIPIGNSSSLYIFSTGVNPKCFMIIGARCNSSGTVYHAESMIGNATPDVTITTGTNNITIANNTGNDMQLSIIRF